MLGSVEVVPGDAVIRTCVLLCFGLGFAFFFQTAEEVRAPSL